MMRLRVLAQRAEEVVLKVEGRIQLLEEAGVLTREGQRWLKQGKRLVLDLGALVEEVLGCWGRIRSLEEEVERLLRQWQVLPPPEDGQEVGQ